MATSYLVNAGQERRLCERLAELDWFDNTLRESADTVTSGAMGVVFWLSAFPFVVYVIEVIRNLDVAISPENLGWTALIFVFMFPAALVVWITTALLVWTFIGLVAITNTSVGFLLSARMQVALLGGLTGYWMVAAYVLHPERRRPKPGRS